LKKEKEYKMDYNKLLTHLAKKLELLKGKMDKESQAVQNAYYYLQVDILAGKFDKDKAKRG
jgi:hypothetical protein